MPRGRPPKRLQQEFGGDPIDRISRTSAEQFRLEQQRQAAEPRLAGMDSERIILTPEDLEPQSNRIILSDADLAPTVNRNEPWDSDQYVVGGTADTKLDPVLMDNGEVIVPRLAGTKPVTAAYDIDDDAIGQVVNPADLERPPIQYDVDPWEAPINVEREVSTPQENIHQLHEKHRAAQEANPTIKAADFGIDERTGQARIAGQKGILQQIKDGFLTGYTFQQTPMGDNGKYAAGRYARSLPEDVIKGIHLPQESYQVPIAERAAITAGRLVGDIAGFGTQSKFWNIHPLDVASTKGFEFLRDRNIDPNIARAGSYAGALALGVGSNNFNPLNLMEGGRQQGFEAISADENDPRQSTNPVMDMVFHRGMLGRTGKLLPWEEFSQERPNVSYEQYEAYKEYLRDPGMMGLVKGTWDGVDGPEARIMGYRVTPLGAIAALGTVGGVAMLAGRRRK